MGYGVAMCELVLLVLNWVGNDIQMQSVVCTGCGQIYTADVASECENRGIPLKSLKFAEFEKRDLRGEGEIVSYLLRVPR